MTEAEKKAQARRRQQNAGVAAGTTRMGAKGKTVRTYNAKTGRWDVSKQTVAARKSTLAKTVRDSAAPKPTKAAVNKRLAVEGPKRSVKPTSNQKAYVKSVKRFTEKKKARNYSRPAMGTAMHMVRGRDGSYRWVTGAAPKPRGK